MNNHKRTEIATTIVALVLAFVLGACGDGDDPGGGGGDGGTTPTDQDTATTTDDY